MMQIAEWSMSASEQSSHGDCYRSNNRMWRTKLCGRVEFGIDPENKKPYVQSMVAPADGHVEFGYFLWGGIMICLVCKLRVCTSSPILVLREDLTNI